MSRPRGLSESSKTPHPISLKVLRLSKPAFCAQCALPKQSSGNEEELDRRAALSCPSSKADETFFLSPLLNLPPSFGTVYVGETLCATVCANNELPLGSTAASTLSNVRLTADIQTPSRKDPTPLELESAAVGAGAVTGEENIALDPGGTLQRVIRFGLREEGNHVLAVTVAYTEPPAAHDGQSPGARGRERTFRKLYQFAAQQLLSVRTKTRILHFGKGGHVLEAQLENLGDQAIHIDSVTVNPKPPLTCESLNSWDFSGENAIHGARPKLQPGNILQVAFLFSQNDAAVEGPESQTKDSRVTLGQIWIHWRGAMGEQGSLNTGWLMGRRG